MKKKLDAVTEAFLNVKNMLAETKHRQDQMTLREMVSNAAEMQYIR